ncbi:MAG: hypothetical protein SFY95_06115, partial [Planctomycetota bacterium]|nr:hypothetical protein [Planctomycetota bacterium]
MIRSARCWAAVAAVMMAGLAAPAWAQTPLSTQFTYQGQLSQLGNAATGIYDLRFRLYDDPTAGDQNGPE